MTTDKDKILTVKNSDEYSHLTDTELDTFFASWDSTYRCTLSDSSENIGDERYEDEESEGEADDEYDSAT